MASIAKPQRRRMRLGRWPLIGSGLVLLVLIAGLLYNQFGRTAPTGTLPPGWQTVETTSGSLNATVSATGNVEPEAQADLRFQVSGIVSEILIKPGDKVEAGQPLARVDTTDLQLQLAKARADLADAQADFEALKTGATPEEIASAEADIARAQGSYQEVAGSVTDADLAAARATLEQARAALAQLEAGPKTSEVQTKQAALDRARAQFEQQQVTLQSTRDEQSKAKTDAERKVQEATIGLQKAQSDYSEAYWTYKNQQDEGRPPSETQGQANPESSDYGNLTAAEAFKKAELELQNAQLTLEQAQKDLEAATQNEVTAIAAAEKELASVETQVREAQADLDELLNGADADELARARADVADAQAKLEQLLGAKRAGSLAAAQADVASAQAKLNEILADPTASELTRKQAAVQRAEVDLQLAERELEQATLTAPFAGIIADVAIALGEPAEITDQGKAAVSLANLNSLHVDVPIDELDIASIQQGQMVELTLDALPGQTLSGTVTRIAPLATAEEQGTRTYEVTVAIDSATAGVRPGMTAVVAIITERRDDVVLIPRRAVVLENGQSYVLRPTDGQPQADGTPASEKVPVQLGLTDGQQVEVVEGLQPGDEVLVQDVVQTLNPFEGQ